MYALVEVKGKQYKAVKDSVIKVDLLDTKEGEVVDLDSVLMIGGEKVSVGKPYVKGASVKAEVKAHGRGKKVRVFKYKKRKDYSRQYGHRQSFTLLTIKDIKGA